MYKHYSGYLAAVLLVVALAACSVGNLLNSGSGDALANLSNGIWTLQAYGSETNPTPALPDRQVTLIFDAEAKTASGSAGCNSYSGSFTLSGSKLSFGPFMSTLMACMPDEINAQESAYLQLMGQVNSIQITGNSLVLTTADGQVLRFQRTAAPSEVN